MRCLLPALICLVALYGCQSAPKQDAETDPDPAMQAQDMRGTFDQMSDAAALADMTVSDYHFVPHRAILTPLGELRLTQLANLLSTYGGQVRFNTDLNDGMLVEERFNAVIAYLGDQGVDVSQDVLTLDMPGSIGMTANEALLIKKHEGRYQPPKEGGGGQVFMFGGGGGD